MLDQFMFVQFMERLFMLRLVNVRSVYGKIVSFSLWTDCLCLD